MAVAPLGQRTLLLALSHSNAPLRCPSFPYALIIMSDILHKVEDVSIMLAPILAIYLLQSEFTLQVWKAARHVPPPPDIHTAASGASYDEAKKAKSQYRFELVCRNIVLLYLLCTGTAGYVMVVVDSDEKKRNDPHFVNPYLASLLFPFSYTVCNSTSIILGRCKRVLFRHEDQRLFVITKRSETWSYFSDLLIVVLQAAMVSGAIFLPSKFLASLLGASIVHILPVSLPRKFSLKDHVLLSIALTYLPVMLFIPTFFGEVNHIHRILSTDVIRFDIDWPSLILGSVLHAGPLQFFASYWRLDSAKLNIDPPPSRFARTSGGMIVSSAFSWPWTRSSPYFLSALAGWVCTVLIVAERLEVVTYANLGFCVAFISPLFMTLAVACTALIRGEARKVWNYEEDWKFEGYDTESNTAVTEIYIKPRKNEPDFTVIE